MITLGLLLLLISILSIYLFCDFIAFLWRIGFIKGLLIVLLIVIIIALCTGCSKEVQKYRPEYEAIIAEPGGGAITVEVFKCCSYSNGKVEIIAINGDKYMTHWNNVLIKTMP